MLSNQGWPPWPQLSKYFIELVRVWHCFHSFTTLSLFCQDGIARKLWPEDVGGIPLLEPSGSLWTSASVISLWLEALTSLCNCVKYVQHACINATKMCLQVLTWQLSLLPVPILSFCTLWVLSKWGWQKCSITMRIHWISIEQYHTWHDTFLHLEWMYLCVELLEVYAE